MSFLSGAAGRLWLGVLGPLLISRFSAAEIYSFVDKDGVVHYTNIPTDSRYRKVGSENQEKKKKPKVKIPTVNQTSQAVITTQYEEYILEASSRFNIPVALVRAVMAVESNFDPNAVSSAGALGLMQLMPNTAEEMGVENPFDPRQSILGGTRYLRKLANSFDGDLVLTLAAYNAGHMAVTRYMDIPPFAETQSYVRRILRLYYFYKKQAKQSSQLPDNRGEKNE